MQAVAGIHPSRQEEIYCHYPAGREKRHTKNVADDLCFAPYVIPLPLPQFRGNSRRPMFQDHVGVTRRRGERGSVDGAAGQTGALTGFAHHC